MRKAMQRREAAADEAHFDLTRIFPFNCRLQLLSESDFTRVKSVSTISKPFYNDIDLLTFLHDDIDLLSYNDGNDDLLLDCVNNVLKHSEAVYEKSKEIASSQTGLQESQAQMKNMLEESMEELHESYGSVVQEISSLNNEAVQIDKKIGIVGDVMAYKMNTLQSKSNDIGNIAGISLDKQKQLLDGKSVALDGLRFLTKFQSQALEESRGTLQQLAELRNKQQDNFFNDKNYYNKLMII